MHYYNVFQEDCLWGIFQVLWKYKQCNKRKNYNNFSQHNVKENYKLLHLSFLKKNLKSCLVFKMESQFQNWNWLLLISPFPLVVGQATSSSRLSLASRSMFLNPISKRSQIKPRKKFGKLYSNGIYMEKLKEYKKLWQGTING